MEVNVIKLEDRMPTEVTIIMSVLELAQITKWLGGLNGFTTPEGLEKFYFESTGDFFNVFWENGLNGCLNGNRQ